MKRGDAVSIVNEKGEEIARGLSYYSAREIDKIKGCKTEKIKEILGFHDYDEVIHRDNLVLL